MLLFNCVKALAADRDYLQNNYRKQGTPSFPFIFLTPSSERGSYLWSFHFKFH